MPSLFRFSPAAVGWAGFYLAVWAAAVAVLAQAPGGSIGEPVTLFVVFVLVLPGVAWLLTRKTSPQPVPVRRPALETGAVLAYLAVVYALVFLVWGLSAIPQAFPDDPARELVRSGAKLLAHVVLPAALLAALGAKVAPLFRIGAGQKGFWLTLVVIGALLLALQVVASPSLKEISALPPTPELLAWAIPGTFVWLLLATGLCEEFLFRAVLQSRLTAFLRSDAGAVAIGALLFGLAHAPGLYLRAGAGEFGNYDNPLHVAAYTIAVLSPTGVFFGYLWSRTKSLGLVVLLHVCIDFLPNLADFVDIWR